MTEELQRLQETLEIFLLIAAVCTTLFPVLWAFSPWWSTTLGRLLMLQSVSYMLAIDFTAYFTFFPPDVESYEELFYLQAVLFGLIAVSSVLLTFTMLKLNYFRRKRKKAEAQDG